MRTPLILALSTLAAAQRDCTGLSAIHPSCASSQTPHTRDVFYVGGTLLPVSNGNLTVSQLYVEKLTPSTPPASASTKPLIFFHGGAVSGATWLNTPDNRAGFASYFLARGHTVYLLDHTSVGRASQMDTVAYALWNTTTQEGVQAGFTAPELKATYPQAKLHTQWPDTGTVGDEAFEAFKKGVVPFARDGVVVEMAMRRAGCELLRHVGEAYLVSHSSGATYPLLLTNDCPEFVAGSINLEHSTQPFWNYGVGVDEGSPARPWGLASTPLDYVPAVKEPGELRQQIVGNDTLVRRNCHLQAEPARQLPKIASVPYLCVTGEASVHATYDHCVIDFLEQAGAKPTWVKLEGKGIHGNGHFMHVEKNNLEIAEVVAEWIAETQER